MTFQLRKYQSEAIEALFAAIKAKEPAPVICLPTGAGKSPVIAEICRRIVGWRRRVLVLAHVKELVGQLRDSITKQWGEIGAPVGVLSAGLGSKTIDVVTVAGIQTAYRRACDIGKVDLVLVDECFTGETLVDTPRGAVRIDSIKPGDIVCTATTNGVVLAKSTKKTHEVCHVSLSDGTRITTTPEHRFFTGAGWKKAGTMGRGEKLFCKENVRVLREDFYANSSREQEINSVWTLGNNQKLFAELLKEDEQSNAQAERTGKGFAENERDRAQTKGTRWKREWFDGTTGKNAKCFGRRMGPRVRCDHKTNTDKRRSKLLQNRHCEPNTDDCLGNRWRKPLHTEKARSRQKKRQTIIRKRVVSVTIEKLSSPITVFNLHMSGHPSYYAGSVLVHNCHMIPPTGEGMYQTLLKDLRTINPALVLAGLTATPYRLQSGLICEPYNDNLPMFSRIVYTAEVRDLIDQGYLSDLRAKNGGAPNLENVHKRGGDFIAEELQAEMGQETKVKAAVDEIMRHGSDRKAWLVFCCGVEHARMVHEEINSRGISSAIVTGDTDADERDETTALFKGKGLRCIVNVNVLTTGFDARHVDLIVLLRPTCSPGLYYQMVGRGLRIEEGKKDCLILDLAGNIERHGPIDKLNEKITSKKKASKGEAPTRTCPECEEVLFAGVRMCPVCGFEFPREVARHETIASDLSPLSGPEIVKREEIDGFDCQVWEKRDNPDAPKTLRVDYFQGFARIASEWLCFNHSGFAWQKAIDWLSERLLTNWTIAVYRKEDGTLGATLENPDGEIVEITTEKICEIAHHCMMCPTAIHTVPDGKFKKIKGYDLEKKAEKQPECVALVCNDEDEVPF